MLNKLLYTFLISIVCVSSGRAQTNALDVIPPNLVPELLALNGDLATLKNPKYLSPTDLALDPEKKFIYVAERQMKRVVQFDVATNRVVKTFLLPNEPTGVIVAKDGTMLYVTCASDRWASGMVCEVSIGSGKVTRRIPAGHYARSPVLSKDGKILYTCNWLGNDLSVIDLAAGVEKTRIKMVREPYAAAITPDGATIVVTNSLPEQKAIDTVSLTGKVSLVNTSTNTVRAVIPVFPVGTHSLFGVCVSADSKYAFVTHLVGRFTLPATTFAGGWIHSNNVAIIDIGSEKLLNDIMIDNSTQGFGNPWGLAQTGDEKFLCVLSAGSHTLTVFDYPKLITMASKGSDLSHEFTALASIKDTLKLSLRAPRSIAMIGNKAYIAGYYSDSIQTVTVSSINPDAGISYALGESKPLHGDHLGEFYFTDAFQCVQKWQSCFSCHPFGRPDALNWMLASESTRQRNAKSMLYSWWTPPTNWNGRRAHAGGTDGSVRMGIYYELGIRPIEEVSIPLDSFLMYMKPVSSPYLVKGKLSETAVRGKAIFERIGCDVCHPAPLYTDSAFYNAGVPDSLDATVNWNTPSLIEAWRTAPYSHSGRYDKIREIIELRAHSLGASQLSEKEKEDLVEFVNSL